MWHDVPCPASLLCVAVRSCAAHTAGLQPHTGIVLTGPFDALAHPDANPATAFLHQRYFFDPPEAQTVAVFPDEPGRHWCLYRDTADGETFVVEARGGDDGRKFGIVDDTLAGALMKRAEECSGNKARTGGAQVLQQLRSMSAPSTRRWKQRLKRVVGHTFCGIGIVVPVVDDVGYRPLHHPMR